MALLSNADLLAVVRAMNRTLSRYGQDAAFTKPQLAAAVTDIDAFLDANATAMNAALPTAFRNTATTPQKQVLFAYVLMKRAGLPLTEE